MTLAEALAYAHEHEPAIAAARWAVAEREQEASVATNAWLPKVGATAQLLASTVNNSTGADVGIPEVDLYRVSATRATASGSLQPFASTLLGLGLHQEIFDFGRIAARRAIADAETGTAQQNERAQRLDVDRDVKEAFFAVLAARSVVQAAQSAYDRGAVHVQLAQEGLRLGLRPVIEVTRAEADLARFEVGRTRAEGGLDVARAALAAAIGSAEESVDASGTIPPCAPLPSLEEALALADERAPAHLAALAQMAAARARSREIGTRLLPELRGTASLLGQAGGAPPSSGSIPPGYGLLPAVVNWDVGVLLTWSLFDGTVTAQRDASETEENVRHAQVDFARQGEITEVRDALVHASVADKALPGLQRTADAARANEEEAEERFRAGLGTAVELADAEELRTNAEIQLALGRFEQVRTRAVLDRATASESPQ
jgi:outer membrane protein TolC